MLGNGRNFEWILRKIIRRSDLFDGIIILILWVWGTYIDWNILWVSKSLRVANV